MATVKKIYENSFITLRNADGPLPSARLDRSPAARRSAGSRVIRVVLALLAGLALVGGLAVSPAHAAGPKWVPEQGSSFQIQYSGRLDLSLPVDVYLLDGGEDTTAAQVAQLKARGVRTVCYINAGAYENWRSDKSKFPPRSVIGKPLDGWDGENWLDVNRIDVLLPIMSARMDVCARRGSTRWIPTTPTGGVRTPGSGSASRPRSTTRSRWQGPPTTAVWPSA